VQKLLEQKFSDLAVTWSSNGLMAKYCNEYHKQDAEKHFTHLMTLINDKDLTTEAVTREGLSGPCLYFKLMRQNAESFSNF